VDVRVICATQKNLVELVQKGVFREDLYYRLNVLTLNIPPLRDCPQDIMPLTELFVARFADEQAFRARNCPPTWARCSHVTAGRATFASLRTPFIVR
jgi:transcriptional regulator of aromatic amino acid metabolism